jgi:hypothetical protein
MRITETLQTIALEEGAANADLDLAKEIIALHKEGIPPETIADKIGCDVDIVWDAIEAPGNYMSEHEYFAIMGAK